VLRLPFPPHALWETRAGAGTPVVLIHGLSASSRWWSKNIDALAERHLVAAVDLTGFGQNRRFYILPETVPVFGELTALLARWIETFDQPVHLVGHSMGGLIAIRLAAERPDLIRSLVLVDAAGMPFHLDPRPHMRALPKPPYGGARFVRVLLPDFLRAGPASVAVAGTRVVRGDVRPMMHAIRVPALLVWGENDPLVPLFYGQAMQEEIPGSKLVVIPRAAHVPMWDAPDEFNRILLDFFDDVEAAPARDVAEPVFSWGISGWTAIGDLGIAHRQAGRRRDLVLLHGLGLSSAYFKPLARALFADGWNPVAPDLPGFGESDNAPPGGPAEHARILAEWADALGIRDAVWLGHSIACNTVAHLERLRPDLVRRAVCVGPVWTASRFPQTRTFLRLALDIFREPFALHREIVRAYWRTGLARWWGTWRRFVPDLGAPPSGALMIAGTRDPLPDRRRVRVHDIPGAHGCTFSHPRELADAVKTLRA